MGWPGWGANGPLSHEEPLGGWCGVARSHGELLAHGDRIESVSSNHI